MKQHLVLPSLLLALSFSANCFAVQPAGLNAGKLPNVTVWDEANVQHSLWDELKAAGPGPVLVLPVYTRCTMSCPVLARMLVQQTKQLGGGQLGGGTPFRVLIYSFDPGDDAAALRQFRAQKGLPASWLLVRSDSADIRRFLDYFHYTVMTEGAVMIHTNQMFLLDHTLEWRATFFDVDWNAADLRTWMSRVESPGIFSWVFMDPELLVYIAFGILSLSLVVIVGVLLRPRASSAVSSPAAANMRG